MEYGCAVRNKFNMVSDDEDIEDPSELVVRAAKEDAAKAAALKKAAAKAAAQPVKKEEPVKPSAKESSTGNVRGRGRGRGERGSHRGGEGRPPRESTELADRFGEGNSRGRGGPRGARGARPSRGRGGNANTSVESPKDTSFDGSNPFEQHETSHERRGGRGGGGFRGGRGRGRHQFDRHSGSDRTGVRHVDKKDGHGKGNWGSDEIAAETEPHVEGETEEAPVPREKTAEELKYDADLAEFNKMKTLREFQAEQKLASSNSEFKIRKAGEGVEDNFGKLRSLQKDHNDNKEDEVIVIRKESSKKVVPINIQFAEANRGGQPTRGRGGSRGTSERLGQPTSGRGRGGFDRGGPRGGRRGSSSALNPSSTEDFPALA